MATLIAILFVIIGLSFLIIIHEAGHFLTAKRLGLLVEEFGFGLPPRFWSKKIGETVYSFNYLPFGGFVRIFGENRSEKLESDRDLSKRAFFAQPVWKRAVIITAGVLMNFLLGWFLVSVVFMIGIPQRLLVSEIKDNSIASAAGIKGGDQILNFSAVPEFVKFIEENKGKEILLNLERNGENLEIKVTPRLEMPEGEGNLGIYLVESGLPKLGFFQSFWEGLKTALGMSAAIFLGLIDLVIGIFTDFRILGKFVGPVGIINMAIGTAKMGAVYFIQLLSVISLNLAVFNLIPIPALDGGKLLFLIVEKLRGRGLKTETEMAANGVSFAFLILLILAITLKDIFALAN